MKKIIALIAVSIATSTLATACVHCETPCSNHRPQVMPLQQSSHGREHVRTMGPMYYEVNGINPNARIKNYSDAPLVLRSRTSSGREDSYVIPRSWD